MQSTVGFLLGIALATIASIVWYALLAEVAAKFVFRTEPPDERAIKSIAAALGVDLLLRVAWFFASDSLLQRLGVNYDIFDLVTPVVALGLAFLWVRAGFRRKWVPDEE